MALPDITADNAQIKAASRELVRLNGGCELAAGRCRVGKSQLSEYQSVNHPGDYMPLDVVAALEKDIGPVVTRQLALLSGHTLSPILNIGQIENFAESLAQVLKETGDVITKSGAALKDGTLTPREKQELATEIEQAISVLAAARDCITSGEC